MQIKKSMLTVGKYFQTYFSRLLYQASLSVYITYTHTLLYTVKKAEDTSSFQNTKMNTICNVLSQSQSVYIRSRSQGKQPVLSLINKIVKS